MNDDYTPQVGDWVRRDNWEAGLSIFVTALGEAKFLARYHDADDEVVWPIAGCWRKVDPPPKRYVVEIREAQPGERWIDQFGSVRADPACWTVPVIVEELS